MVDIITPALLAASAFFVMLAFVLLVRYRQISRQINVSNDLGRDLWQALEARLKKQDERILDMMGRVEVIQARALQGLSHPAVPEPQTKAELEKETRAETQKKGKAQAEKQSQVPEVPKTEAEKPKEGEKSQPEKSQVTSQKEVTPAEPGLAKEIEARLVRQDEALTGITAALTAIQSQLKEASARAPPVLARTASKSEAESQPHERTKVDNGVLMGMLAQGSKTSVEVRKRFNISREHANRVLKSLYAKGLVTENADHKPFVYELTEAGRKSLAAS